MVAMESCVPGEACTGGQDGHCTCPPCQAARAQCVEGVAGLYRDPEGETLLETSGYRISHLHTCLQNLLLLESTVPKEEGAAGVGGGDGAEGETVHLQKSDGAVEVLYPNYEHTIR